MAIVLALMTALFFGLGDFCGGLAGRTWPVRDVILVAHVVGLVGVLGAALTLADQLLLADLLWGALGGVGGVVGLALLYRGLARGPMGVVAPLTAVMSAAVPTGWGLAVAGDHLTLPSGVAVLLAALAIIGASSHSGDESPLTPLAILEALLAGAGFGLMFIALDQTDPSSGAWSIVGARCTSLALLFVAFVWRTRQLPSPRRLLPNGSRSGLGLVIAVGILDTGGNVMFLLGIQRGALSVVAILTSLYPVITVLLARVVLRERLSSIQTFAVGLALGASVLFAAGS